MDDLQLKIPASLRPYVDEQVAQRGYRDAADFVRSLIEADQQREYEKDVQRLLLETIDGPFSDWSESDLDDIRRLGRAVIDKRRPA